MAQDSSKLDLVSFPLQTRLIESSTAATGPDLNSCVTSRDSGLYRLAPVSGHFSLFPNFWKDFLRVLSLYFRARVNAQEAFNSQII